MRSSGRRARRARRPAAEAARAVVHRKPRNRSHVPVRKPAEHHAMGGPVPQLSARNVARSDGQVGVGSGRQQARKRGRVVGKIRVHLADVRGVRAQRRRHAFDVRTPQSAGAWPSNHRHSAGAGPRQGLGGVARAIGRVVVHDHHAQAVDRHQRGDEPRQVVTLVVGGNQDERPHRHGPATTADHRTGATRSAPRSIRPGTR